MPPDSKEVMSRSLYPHPASATSTERRQKGATGWGAQGSDAGSSRARHQLPGEASLCAAKHRPRQAHRRCPAWPRSKEDIRTFVGLLTSPFTHHPCASFD